MDAGENAGKGGTFEPNPVSKKQVIYVTSKRQIHRASKNLRRQGRWATGACHFDEPHQSLRAVFFTSGACKPPGLAGRLQNRWGGLSRVGNLPIGRARCSRI